MRRRKDRHMRVTITTSGSRGDVQPYVALGLGLRPEGHEVTVAAPGDFRGPVRSRGLGFFPICGDPLETTGRMLEGGGGLKNFAKNAGRALRPVLAEMLRGYREACEDADAIVYTPVGFFGHTLAGALGLPRFGAAVQPIFNPTRHFPSAFVPQLFGVGHGPLLPVSRLYNRASHAATEQALWHAIRKPVNDAVREVLGTRPYAFSGPFGELRRGKEPGVFGWSPSLLPKPPDWRPEVEVTGFWFVPPDEGWRPPPGLVDFLEEGPPPISVGFGSMLGAGGKPLERLTETVLAALERTRQRAVLLTGWGNLGATGGLPEGVFAIEEAPHDWLFPRVAAAVHHGGAGTTAASLRAGVPTVTVPFFTDQPFWGSRVARLGVGPEPVPRKRLSAERLAVAMDRAVGDEGMRLRARRVGGRIRSEDGVRRAAEAFQRYVVEPSERRSA
jgi:sterol 3beta-glucosyltransferase